MLLGTNHPVRPKAAHLQLPINVHGIPCELGAAFERTNTSETILYCHSRSRRNFAHRNVTLQFFRYALFQNLNVEDVKFFQIFLFVTFCDKKFVAFN